MISRRMRCIVLAVYVATGCSAGHRTASVQPSAAVGQTRHFAFYSDAWVNLHHFLYAWAQSDAGTAIIQLDRADRKTLSALSAPERGVWEAALRFYRDSLIRGNRFQENLSNLKRELAQHRALGRAGSVVGVLQDAMPVYRRHWWPVHDESNAAWIRRIVTILEPYEAGFVELTTRVHNANWGQRRWPIDLVTHAPALGYASHDGHVVVHSTNPGTHELYGVEILFHEMQHTAPVAGSLPYELARAFDLTGLEPPPQIGHALIYVTAGESVRSIAAKLSQNHTPLWIAREMGQTPIWQEYESIVREYWIPVLRGEQSTSRGLANIANALKLNRAQSN
jgi:hypothetical protein